MNTLFAISSFLLVLLTFSEAKIENNASSLNFFGNTPEQESPVSSKKPKLVDSDQLEEKAKKKNDFNIYGLVNSFQELSLVFRHVSSIYLFKDSSPFNSNYTPNLPRSPPINS